MYQLQVAAGPEQNTLGDEKSHACPARTRSFNNWFFRNPTLDLLSESPYLYL